MPGIVGIIGKGPGKENTAALHRMVKCMMHEPSYVSGTCTDEKLGLNCGWICHAGSFSDCLPIWNETGDIGLIFSGEDFSDLSEIDALRQRGHRFNSENANYLIHLYEEYGSAFFQRLNGWFSGLLIDRRERKIVLFNDRYGLGRIYYHESDEGFYFASEAKSLLRILPQLRQLDFIGLAETFSCGCVLQNRTLFPGIALLPGGSCWTFTKGHGPSKDVYFSREQWEAQPLLDGASYYEMLKDTFPRILKRYFRGSQRMGISLTGGVDSRMVMSWANRPEGSLPCYTFGGTYRDCTDVKIARKVAKICRQSHQIISVDRAFLSQFPRLAEQTVYITDGTMDVSGSPDLFINKAAKEIAPVRMTGNYGGEILRSLIAFKPRSMSDGIFSPEFRAFLTAAPQTYRTELADRQLAFVAFKQVPWHHYSRLSLEMSQLTLRSPYLDNDLVSLAFRAPTECATSKELSLRLVADGSPTLAHIETDRGLLYEPVPVVTRIRNLYEEFTFKAEYAYDYGMPQWIAAIDHTLSPLHLEHLFLGRHKFHHFRVWYRDELSPYLKDMLLDSRTLARPYFNRRRLEQIVHDHTSGRKNYTSEIHRVLTSELIQRTLIEQVQEPEKAR